MGRGGRAPRARGQPMFAPCGAHCLGVLQGAPIMGALQGAQSLGALQGAHSPSTLQGAPVMGALQGAQNYGRLCKAFINGGLARCPPMRRFAMRSPMGSLQGSMAPLLLLLLLL